MIRFLFAAAAAAMLSSCGIAQGLASRASGALNSTTRMLLSPVRLSDTPEQNSPDAAQVPVHRGESIPSRHGH